MNVPLLFSLAAVSLPGPGAPTPAADAQPRGLVAVVTRPFAFDQALARELCPGDGMRVLLCIGGAGCIGGPDATAPDPLAALGSPTPVLELDPRVPFAGEERETARRAREAVCIVLSGGTWVDWWSLLEPHNKITRLGRALVDAHRAGASIVGIGPAGSYLCDLGMLSRGQMQEPTRDPHDLREHVAVSGFDLVHGACFDFVQDGRVTMEDMLAALCTGDVRRAVWLSGTCAWIQSADGRTARVAGADGAAIVLDLGAGRRTRGSVHGGLLLRLEPGDAFLLDDSRTSGGTAWAAPRVADIGSKALDDRLGGVDWTASRQEQRISGNPGKVVDLRGKGARMRLYPGAPVTDSDVPPSARATSGQTPAVRWNRAGWIRFDWIGSESARSP